MPNQAAKDLSQYRISRAEELVDDAKDLYKKGSYKSSNNRAYYAIFNAMRAVLALDEEDFKKHSGVIQYFQKTYIKTAIFDRKYSDVIVSASNIRNSSDYDDFFIASAEEARQQIEDAELFCEAVKEYLTHI